MGKHHEPSATSAKKARTKEYFAQAKRRQRARRRAEYGVEQNLDEMRREKRQQRLADLFLVGVPDSGGKYRFWTYRGRRSRLQFGSGDFGWFGLSPFPMPADVAAEINVRRSARDLAVGKRLADYAEVELRAHALAIAWMYFRSTAVLEKYVGVRIARLERRLLLGALPWITAEAKQLIMRVYQQLVFAYAVTTNFALRARLLPCTQLCELELTRREPLFDGAVRPNVFRELAGAIASQGLIELREETVEHDAVKQSLRDCRSRLLGWRDIQNDTALIRAA